MFEEGGGNAEEERRSGNDCGRNHKDFERCVLRAFIHSNPSCPVDDTILEAAPLQYKLACVLLDIIHVVVVMRV